MASYKTKFLDLAMESQALQLGSFTLKSGRESPYFFNIGYFSTGKLLSNLATSYANAIIEWDIDFDVLFGPAYKGIPLASVTIAKLAELKPEKYGNVGYSFNRKEKKDHGEGGSIVGTPLKGAKILIIDDVITAGTAINEAFDIAKVEGGDIVGCILALDREETTYNSTLSATQAVSEKQNVPIKAIVTLSDIISHLDANATEEDLKRMQEYREKYAPK